MAPFPQESHFRRGERRHRVVSRSLLPVKRQYTRMLTENGILCIDEYSLQYEGGPAPHIV